MGRLLLASALLTTACAQSAGQWTPCDCEQSAVPHSPLLEFVSVSLAPGPGLVPFSYNQEQVFVADGQALCTLDDVASAAVMGDPDFPPYLAVWLTSEGHARAWAGATWARHNRRLVAVRLEGELVEIAVIQQVSRVVFLELTPLDHCTIVCATQADPASAEGGV